MLIFTKLLRPIGVIILAAAIALGPSSVVAQDDPTTTSRSNVNLRGGGQNESHHDKLTTGGLQRPDEMAEGDTSLSTELVLFENTERRVAEVEEFSVGAMSTSECDALLKPQGRRELMESRYVDCPTSIALTKASLAIVAALFGGPTAPALVTGLITAGQAGSEFLKCPAEKREEIISKMMIRGMIAAGIHEALHKDAKATACTLITSYTSFLEDVEHLNQPKVNEEHQWVGLYNPEIVDRVNDQFVRLLNLHDMATSGYYIWHYTTGFLIDMASRAIALGTSQMSAFCSPGEEYSETNCASVGGILQNNLDRMIRFLKNRKAEYKKYLSDARQTFGTDNFGTNPYRIELKKEWKHMSRGRERKCNCPNGPGPCQKPYQVYGYYCTVTVTHEWPGLGLQSVTATRSLRFGKEEWCSFPSLSDMRDIPCTTWHMSTANQQYPEWYKKTTKPAIDEANQKAEALMNKKVDQWWRANIQNEAEFDKLLQLENEPYASLCCKGVAKYPELVKEEIKRGKRETPSPTSEPTPEPSPFPSPEPSSLPTETPLPPLKVTVKSIKCLSVGDGWHKLNDDEIWLEKNGHQVWPAGSGQKDINKNEVVNLTRNEKGAVAAYVSSEPTFILKDYDPMQSDKIGGVSIQGSEIKYPNVDKYGRRATATSKKVWTGAGRYEIEFEFAYEADWA